MLANIVKNRYVQVSEQISQKVTHALLVFEAEDILLLSLCVSPLGETQYIPLRLTCPTKTVNKYQKLLPTLLCD